MDPFLMGDQPIAGPSLKPFISPSPFVTPLPCTLDSACPFLYTTPTITQTRRATNTFRPGKLDQIPDVMYRRGFRRQDSGEATSTTSTASLSDLFSGPTANGTSTTTQRPLFTGPAPSATSETSSTSTSFDNSGSYNTSDPSAYGMSSTTSATVSRSTTFTSLWSYTPSRVKTYTASVAQPSQTAFVPGVLLNLTLAGDSDTEAVYSVNVALGHNANARRKRGLQRRRPPAWNGVDVQMVQLQVDLGSSDMWVASTDCTSTYCQSAPSLFDISQSLDSGVPADITYQSGSVNGEIYWEEISVGDFGIGYQAFIAAVDVTNEDLQSGEFSGVLGLALPASSTILNTIGGTTGSNPDGATFLDNLFGAGSSAPTERLFSLALERREDVRTISSFGIGTVNQNFCPSPCEPPYIPIISQPQLGLTGYLHWRIPLQGLSVTTWSDAEHGQGPTTLNVTLGPSQVYPAKSMPLAVLDSGGVQILTGYRQYADQIYNAMGISMSSDGFYRMPCTQQLAVTFNIAGQNIPVHPLDMTYPDPEDASQKQCIGMIQYSSNLGDSGDFILGSAFMKNVYSIFQYPDTNKQKTWQPTVGLIPLTNASVASQDFYAVRVQRQSLSSVSSNQQASTGGHSPTNPGSQPSQAAAEKKVVNTTVIAVVSVIGFFVLAAAAFCAWWFWLRRKFGASGVVDYKSAPERPRVDDYKSDGSFTSLRTKKHTSTQRQKSMVEGFSGTDYEADSWMSTTEGNDSIRLGYLPEVAEEDDDARRTRAPDKRSSRGSTVGADGTDTEDYQLIDMSDPLSPGRTRTRSPPPPLQAGHQRIDSVDTEMPYSANSENIPLTTAPVPYSPPAVSNPQNSRKTSMSMSGPFPSAPPKNHMSGPFPSPGANRQSVRPDISPMYDIRVSDYFAVPPVTTRGRDHRRGSSSVSEGRRESNGRRKSSPSRGPSGIDEAVREEDR
ncbi:uncharacterized protein L201_000471 [Kwoniella dendrophila CBS 6074]|uniref:Peptidase A1 domain-containing protein n=1 Tax=Kwoniella dendrophila CBS 6074 TaxID=1295534 RepID=A0AAX4JJL6_9TREE